LGFMSVTAVQRTLIKLTSGVNFTNISHAAFTCTDPKRLKNSVKLSVSFFSFGICAHKSCEYNVDEIYICITIKFFGISRKIF